MAIDNSEEQGLLDAFDAGVGQGWQLGDLKELTEKARDFQSARGVARIRALAKLDIISRNNGYTLAPSLNRKIFELNPANRLIKNAGSYYVFEISTTLRLLKLPKGYGFKGGAARLALYNIFGANPRNLIARDIDLIRLEDRATGNLDHKLAAEYMPEDFKHGHGVEVIRNINSYLNTRDLSINEILLLGKRLYCSKIAFNDAEIGAIRLSKHYSQRVNKIEGKILCKILRLAAERKAQGLTVSIPEFPHSHKVSTFDYQINLQRAGEVSERVKQIYTELFEEYLVIEESSSKFNSQSRNRGFQSLSLQNELRKSRKPS